METVFEKVYVETPVDTDQDGQCDLIAVYIKRPVTDERLPVVYVANPYMLHCNENWYDLYPVDNEVKVYPTQNISLEDVTYHEKELPSYQKREVKGIAEHNFMEEPDPSEYECISDLYSHLIERGYACVFSAGLGTRGSDGVTISGSHEEILAFKSVIDWLNDRCHAFTDRTNNIEIKATWCTGNVAMSAKSYLGTMCIGVAATGVDGLKTIIPEAGISNWYDYYRCNGLNLPAFGWQGDDIDILAKYCFSRALDPDDYKSIQNVFEVSQKELQKGMDRDSGNYNVFWDERNYLKNVDRMKASVFVIQGLNDWNVKPDQGIRLFEKLQEQKKDRLMLLHQGEHVYTYHLEGSPTLDLIDRWLDFYLKGMDTGIQNESKVFVESNLDPMKWMQEEMWPPKKTKIVSDLGMGIESFVDDLNETAYVPNQDEKAWLDELVSTKGLHFPLLKTDTDLRLAGRAKVSFQARIDQPTAILSAMLVDVGKQNRLRCEVVGDVDVSYTFEKEKEASNCFVITRGWLNAQNRSNNYSKEEIDTSQWYEYSFEMVSNDYTMLENHDLELILYGIDAQETQRPYTRTKIEVDVSTIKVELPIE